MTSFVNLNIHWHRTELRERERENKREKLISSREETWE